MVIEEWLGVGMQILSWKRHKATIQSAGNVLYLELRGVNTNAEIQ